MPSGAVSQDTLDLIKAIVQSGALSKANTVGIQQATGITNYDLEPRAKHLYPVITPIRNWIPRARGMGDTATHWKTITAINPSNASPGVSEGNRGAVIDQTEVDRIASYKGLGLENSITEEAIYAAEGFDNALAIMADILLRAVFIAEEKTVLMGNNSLAFGVPATPTGVSSTTGGTLGASAANTAYVVALTYDGFLRSTVAGGVATTFNKTNADGSVDSNIGAGSSNKSLQSTAVTTTGSTASIQWNVTAIPGAAAYAWYSGVGGAGTQVLSAITTTNAWLQTAIGAGTQAASAITADNSRNQLIFDGLVTQVCLAPPSGASGYLAATGFNTYGYFNSLNGLTLTGNSDGSITEIENVLQQMWETFRVTPTMMWVNSQEARNITKKVLASGSTPVYRVNMTNDQAAGIVGGTFVAAYYNKYAPGGPRDLPIEVHPNMPPGTIFFDCREVPYPLANIPGPYRIKARREFYQTLWPQTTRTRFTGVYVDEVLELYTPFALGVLDNIANG
jgi:hypothetical protein